MPSSILLGKYNITEFRFNRNTLTSPIECSSLKFLNVVTIAVVFLFRFKRF